MAALRERLVRVMYAKDVREAIRAKEWLKEYQAKFSSEPVKKSGRPKAYGTPVKYWEIVATLDAEVKSGIFIPSGTVYVFSPAAAEAYLWDKIRNIEDEHNIELWSHPGLGIRRALLRMGIKLPWLPKGSPLSDMLHIRITKKESTAVDDQTIQEHPFYENFIRNIWIPNWLYSGSSKNGLFKTKDRAKTVAKMLNIPLDTQAKSNTFIRTPAPDVEEEAKRSVEYTEEAYIEFKRQCIDTMRMLWQRGRPFHPDWDIIGSALRNMVGSQYKHVVDRLKVDLAPVIETLDTTKPEYEENGPVKARKRHLKPSHSLPRTSL